MVDYNKIKYTAKLHVIVPISNRRLFCEYRAVSGHNRTRVEEGGGGGERRLGEFEKIKRTRDAMKDLFSFRKLSQSSRPGLPANVNTR